MNAFVSVMPLRKQSALKTPICLAERFHFSETRFNFFEAFDSLFHGQS
jgi:hypothetical protein